MDGHAPILRVFLAQEQNGSTMSRSAKQNLGSSGDQQIGETSPIFIVSIDDQRNFRILCDVPQPFELMRRNLLGFFIDR